ncbi:MAG: hypothetical protein II367_03805 [Treponema sp.]|nr:hypothetical protein [Treponema sp.]
MLLNKKIKQIFAVLAGILVLSVASYAQTSQDALIQPYLEKATLNLMTEISKVHTKILMPR